MFFLDIYFYVETFAGIDETLHLSKDYTEEVARRKMNIRGIKSSSSSVSEVQLPLVNSESENLLEDVLTDKEYNEAVGLELEEDVFEDIRDRFFGTFLKWKG